MNTAGGESNQSDQWQRFVQALRKEGLGSFRLCQGNKCSLPGGPEWPYAELLYKDRMPLEVFLRDDGFLLRTITSSGETKDIFMEEGGPEKAASRISKLLKDAPSILEEVQAKAPDNQGSRD